MAQYRSLAEGAEENTRIVQVPRRLCASVPYLQSCCCSLCLQAGCTEPHLIQKQQANYMGGAMRGGGGGGGGGKARNVASHC